MDKRIHHLLVHVVLLGTNHKNENSMKLALQRNRIENLMRSEIVIEESLNLAFISNNLGYTEHLR